MTSDTEDHTLFRLVCETPSHAGGHHKAWCYLPVTDDVWYRCEFGAMCLYGCGGFHRWGDPNGMR